MPMSLDLPLITEATNDYYRNIYADPDLGPIFKGVNMVVLRTHVSYFINQLTMFDSPLSKRQLEYLRKVHEPIILQHGVTQHHYDLMLKYLTEAMRANGAEEVNLESVQYKLLPLRDIFPPSKQSAQGHMLVQEHEQSDAGDVAPDAAGKLCREKRSGKPAWVKRLVKAFKKPVSCPMSTTSSASSSTSNLNGSDGKSLQP